MRQPHRSVRIHRQKGAALIVSLVMLTAVTFVAVIALQGTTVQARMVGNTQLDEQSFAVSHSEIEGRLSAYANSTIQSNPELSEAARDWLVDDSNEIILDENFQPIAKARANDAIGNYEAIGFQAEEIDVDLQFKGNSNGTTGFNQLAGNSSIGQFENYTFEVTTRASATEQISSTQRTQFDVLIRVGSN